LGNEDQEEFWFEASLGKMLGILSQPISREWWHTSVILATAESIGKIMIRN
jgi:hypothetical protein